MCIESSWSVKSNVATQTIQLANNLLYFEYPIKRISFAVPILETIMAALSFHSVAIMTVVGMRVCPA